MDIKDKVVLIAGSSGDIGAAIALELAKEGAIVCLQYNKSKAKAEKTQREINNLGSRASIFSVNLNDFSSVQKLVEQIEEEHGQLDLLINCVGDFLFKSLDDLSSEEFRNIIDSNLNIAFDLCQSVLPLMRRSGIGKIINLGYANATKIEAKPNILPYHIAKMGLVLLTKSFAKEEIKNNIYVNCLSLGVVETSDYWPNSETVLRRPIEVVEVVEAAKYLIESDYLTGLNLEIDSDWR